MPGVPFVDLHRQHAEIREELDRAWAGQLERGDFILGAAVPEFERAFADYCGVDHAIGVGSGLDALVLTLEALGIGAGDEVITVANTFVATVNAIARTGARPVLVDALEETLEIDPEAVERACTPRTRALLPVHLFGTLCEIERLAELAGRLGLSLVEDAAQAHGAERDGRRAGSWGDAGCFSFYPTKNLGALGDGGAVVTRDAELADRLRLLRCYGERPKNVHGAIGVNSRLDSLQAGVLRIKLDRLDDWNASRRATADRYRERLAGLPLRMRADDPPPSASVHHLFVIRVAERDRVRERLQQAGIGTGVHYPVPVHLQPAYRSLGRGPGSFPVAESAARELISLPIFPGMTGDEVDRVAEALRAAL